MSGVIPLELPSIQMYSRLNEMSDNRQSFKLCTLKPLWSSHLPPLESSGVKRACRGLKPFSSSGQKPWLIRELKQTWGSDCLSASPPQHQLLASHSIPSFRMATRNGNSYIQHKDVHHGLHSTTVSHHLRNSDSKMECASLEHFICHVLHRYVFWRPLTCLYVIWTINPCNLQKHNVKGDRNTNSQHRLGFKCFLTHSGFRSSTDFNIILAQ